MICGFFDLTKWGRQYFETMKVPLTIMECIRSNFFIDWSMLLFQSTAEALFIRISIPPKVSTTFSILFLTYSSNLISHLIGRAFPPAFVISYAAVYMVPGNLGWGLSVFAKIATLAPSLAHLMAMASPMPLEAPVMTIVFPSKPLFLSSLSLPICEAKSYILFIFQIIIPLFVNFCCSGIYRGKLPVFVYYFKAPTVYSDLKVMNYQIKPIISMQVFGQ